MIMTTRPPERENPGANARSSTQGLWGPEQAAPLPSLPFTSAEGWEGREALGGLEVYVTWGRACSESSGPCGQQC